MKKLDCLFVHPTTHIKTPFSSQEDSVIYVVMPMGTIALADLLRKEGYETKIVHTGMEHLRNRDFDVEGILKGHADVVGIDLHWYCHSYDAIRIAEVTKKVSDSFVVLGGFTASYFAEEILSHFESVDAVIKGDAEAPLLELMRHRRKAEFSEVPNLIYRDGESLKRSQKTYVAEASDLERLNFSNLCLLEGFDEYRRNLSQFGHLDPSHVKARLKTQGWLCIGRGCSVNCSYCGGGSDSFEVLTGRTDPIFRPVAKVIETLARFEEMKISCAYMDFDPYPSNRKYYYELFRSIQREKIDISAQFLMWSLSDREFIAELKRTFNPTYSTVTISPESGCERVRTKNKGFQYSNDELLRWLDDLREERMPIQAYFTSGLSGETESNFEDTIKLGKKLVEEYPVVSISCNPIELEPASPRFLHPKEYGITVKTRSFTDFFNTFKSLASGLPVASQLGYETDYLTEPEIIKLSLRFREAVTLAHSRQLEELYPGAITDMHNAEQIFE